MLAIYAGGSREVRRTLNVIAAIAIVGRQLSKPA